jgi:hypothetical protein
MSQITVNTINPYFIGGDINLNGTPIRNNGNSYTIGIGQQALVNSIGSHNVAVGRLTLSSLVNGNDNVAIGHSSLQQIEGFSNVAIGTEAGQLSTSGGNNIFIGDNAQSSTPTSSNEITLGNSSNTVIRAAVTTITSLSDKRDKKKIEPLNVGLDFINKLNPVTFVWDERDENGKHDIKDFGFIAQDLKTAQEDINLEETLKLVYEENPDKLEASYGKLVPILVKAIQDLSKEIENLKNKLN